MRKYACLESSVSGIRYSKCKGPEARACLLGSRNSEEACVAGAEGDGKSRRSEVRKETTKGHSPDTLQRCSVPNQVYLCICVTHIEGCVLFTSFCALFFSSLTT